MMPPRLGLLVRAALVIGFAIDFIVGVISIVAQPLLAPLFDIPVKDPAVTTIAGGELVVASIVYVLALRDLRRFHPLLWLCAFDQALGVLLPALEITRGHVDATWKTLGPMPVQLVLVAVLVAGARYAMSAKTPAGTGA